MYSHKLPFACVTAAVSFAGSLAQAQTTISYASGTITQSFDSLSNANVASVFTADSLNTQSAIPGLPGWSGTKVAGALVGGTPAVPLAPTPLTASNGGANSGGIYSFGVNSATERALGVIASGSNVMAFGAEFVNDSGSPISSVTITFNSEFWRSSTSIQNKLDFAYGFSGGSITPANYLSSASMLPGTVLNLVGPAPIAANGALDGNVAPNRGSVSATLSGLNWLPGTSLFIRWTDVNDAGNDAGLALDDFTLTGTINTGADVSIGAGNLFTANSFGGAAFESDDTAFFVGAGKTVTLSNSAGAVAAAALKFANSGFELAGTSAEPLTVSGAVTVDTGVEGTISGVLAGSAGLTKQGQGTLTLSGANTFTGNISISGKLVAASDAALGATTNDIIFASATSVLGLPASYTLGSDRNLQESGVIEQPTSGSFTFAGSASTGSLTFNGTSTLTFAGAVNSVQSVTFQQAVAINATGGPLELGGSVTFNQTSGTSVLSGAFTTAGARTLFVAGGTVQPTGSLTLGAYLTKQGAGLLDLSGATVSGSTPTTGGIQMGTQGGSPVEGGSVRIVSGANLANSQLRFNSGTLNVVGNLSAPVGLSIGGREDGVISEPTITGGDLVLSGTSGFFNATNTTGRIIFNANNTTTLSGAFAPTSTSSLLPTFVGIGGTGTVVLGGDATRLIDFFVVTDSSTLVVNGTLGGERLRVEANATVSGSGTFAGSSPWEELDANPNNALTQPASPIYVASSADILGTLAPSGVLTIKAATTFSGVNSTAILEINGLSRGTEYDALAVEVPAGSGFNYNLTYGGTLILDFGSAAISGSYNLISVGSGVSRTGSFGAVQLAGNYSQTLIKPVDSTVWGGASGGATFSFDESTGVLTVTGGVTPTTPLEDWLIEYFGTAEDTELLLIGATEDFDGDGLSNLLEYAFDTDPTLAGVSPVAVVREGNVLKLTYPRIADTALTYTVLGSADLTAGFGSTAGGTVTAGGVSTYTDTVDLSAPGVRRFLRVSVTYTE